MLQELPTNHFVLTFMSINFGSRTSHESATSGARSAAQVEIAEPVSSLDLLALARSDFACYCLALWPGFQLAAHHRVLIDHLEAVEQGRIRRLMIQCPPRHGKSTLASQLFPAWYLGRHPDRAVITASYGQELADDFGRRVRDLLRDPFHGAIFPDCCLADGATSFRSFRTTAFGTYYATGRGGPITGRGADLFVGDDLLKDYAEANSEVIRRSLHEWYAAVAYTRLQPGAAIILVQTRWHEDDLAGRILREHAADWTVLNLPAIAKVDGIFRKAGEALWPERFPVKALDDIRAAVGGSVWAALYDQMPSAAEGTIFKRRWFRFFSEQPRFSRIVQSWDTSFKTGAENDFSACTTWGVAENGYYLLWFWKGKAEFPELKRKMQLLAEAWNPSQIFVEDAASGQSLLQEMRVRTALPILPVKVDKDKTARAQAVTPLFEAGRVFLPQSAPWSNEYIDELAAFPNGVHDDAVDSTTQALNQLRYRRDRTLHVHPVYL
jgi:predicted phage terminase large subunit-like protein